MMKNILGVCCGILATTAVLSAQTPAPAPAPQTPPTTSSTTSTTRQTAQTVTITGCVTPDLTANPDPASATTRRFLLSNIEPSAAGQPRVTGYILTPNADVNLSDHLNHKVQITGTVESVTSSSTTSQSSPSTSSTTQSSTTTMPSFRVTSVKMVSATCP